MDWAGASQEPVKTSHYVCRRMRNAHKLYPQGLYPHVACAQQPCEERQEANTSSKIGKAKGLDIT